MLYYIYYKEKGKKKDKKNTKQSWPTATHPGLIRMFSPGPLRRQVVTNGMHSKQQTADISKPSAKGSVLDGANPNQAFAANHPRINVINIATCLTDLGVVFTT